MDHWTVPYLGRPYVPGGCLLLFCEVQRARYGRTIDLGPVPETAEEQAWAFKRASRRHRWIEVKLPIDGDGVLLGFADRPHHIGTYVEARGGPRLLHSLEGHGTACPTLAAVVELARFNVIGFYRPAGEVTA